MIMSFVGISLLFLHVAVSVTIFEVGHYQGPIDSLPEGEFPTPERMTKLLEEPILLKGAAKTMPAINWTDEYLFKHFPRVRLDQVESEKLETRTAEVRQNEKMESFLKRYRQESIYGISTVPKEMLDGIHLLPFFNCGGLTKNLRQHLLWFSSGGTASVIHYDVYNNQYCLFSGSKRFAFWHPTNSKKIESKEFGWYQADEEDIEEQAYGEYAKLNVSDVDLARFPGWDTLSWKDATIEAGDCLVFPNSWYHHVAATSERSLAVNVWFSDSSNFDQESCDKVTSLGFNQTKSIFTFGDCQYSDEETECSLKRAWKRHHKNSAEKTEL